MSNSAKELGRGVPCYSTLFLDEPRVGGGRSWLAIGDQLDWPKTRLCATFSHLPFRVSQIQTQNSPLALVIIVIRFISCPFHARLDEI